MSACVTKIAERAYSITTDDGKTLVSSYKFPVAGGFRPPVPHPGMKGVWVVPLSKKLGALIDEYDLDKVVNATWFAKDYKGKYYAASRINGKEVKLHRIILPNTNIVDHINRNTLDNRRCNLREASLLLNRNNSTGWRKSSSKYKGVTYEGRSQLAWVAQIRKGKKCHKLGRFALEENAAKAYDKAALRLHGPDAYTNFPKSNYNI